jgi:hypothetical protein
MAKAGMFDEYVYGQLTKDDLEYQARLEYCYDLLDDISDDFGWWWQEQKKVQFNKNCRETLGYMEVDEEKLNYGR